jgi:hypothetical protein
MPRFGRPGLLGTMARTAVVTGTATAVSGRVARRQQQRYVEQEEVAAASQREQYQAAAPAPAPSSGPDVDLTAELERLAELKARGLLTDEEFAAAKSQLLGL